jgi:nicotinamide riboside kinase
MKIAFTGTSSTGKTTLINELFKHDDFKSYKLSFSTTDARSLLNDMGAKQMDLMTDAQRITFQKLYFQKKKEQELEKNNFIVDRSFVDVASYWLVRECKNDIALANENDLLLKSKALSMEYDVHFYFPYGVIPFEADGYRSENDNQRKEIGVQIHTFLNKWQLKYVSLDIADLSERVKIVIKTLQGLKH